MQKISLNVSELHRKFSWYGRNAREWARKCATLLPEIERERVWEVKGFGSIYEYAARLAGMSHSSVDEALRVLKKIEDKPALMEVAEKFGISAVRPVAVVATVETAEFWAEKASEMSKHTLQAYVNEIKIQPGLEIMPEKVDLHAEVSRELAEKLVKLKGQGEWEKLFEEFLNMREKMLAQEKPEEKITASRHIPVEIERFVMRRSRGQCEFPRCQKKYSILHHTQRFALEHVHDPSRIVALCKAHERMVHLGLVEDEKIMTGQWKIMKWADKKDPRYAIDQLVGKYRNRK